MLLAIDTAAHLCAAAVFDVAGDRLVSEASEDIGRGHAERLMDVIGAALDEANCDYSDITQVAATVGPGSFTGIRVGLATARGIALALSVPASGVGTLDAAQARALELSPDRVGQPVLAALDARRGEVYAQYFETPGAPKGPFVMRVEELAAMLGETAPSQLGLCGSAAAQLYDLSGKGFDIIHELAAASIATIAAVANRLRDTRPEPLYLRAPDAKPQAGPLLQRA